MSELPRRVPNHATGYRYTKHDHQEAWLMSDGSKEVTGWIEPGDTASLDKAIEGREKQIQRLQAEIRLYEQIREAVAQEKTEK
jgi:hypothetical protein